MQHDGCEPAAEQAKSLLETLKNSLSLHIKERDRLGKQIDALDGFLVAENGGGAGVKLKKGAERSPT